MAALFYGRQMAVNHRQLQVQRLHLQLRRRQLPHQDLLRHQDFVLHHGPARLLPDKLRIVLCYAIHIEVERVVLNALGPQPRDGFAASYLRLQRILYHRLRRSRSTESPQNIK